MARICLEMESLNIVVVLIHGVMFVWMLPLALLAHLLESGRKAKYFRWLTKRARISYEYVVVARRCS